MMNTDDAFGERGLYPFAIRHMPILRIAHLLCLPYPSPMSDGEKLTLRLALIGGQRLADDFQVT
jgi:hypothetical protein